MTESQELVPKSRRSAVVAVVGLICLAAFAIYYFFVRDDISAGGEFFKPLKIVVDIPGIENPELVEVDQAKLSNATSVVGIVVDDQPIAIVVDAMEDYVKHVVNLHINETAVSVTYCDLANCVRVFSDQRDSAIPLRNGGLDENNQLVLMLDETRYGQESEAVPLQDHPYKRTSLGEWKKKYPNTKVLESLPQQDGDPLWVDP